MAGTPDGLVTSGAYRWTRNPMYLGHLIFSLGLVAAFPSPITALLALTRAVYFQLRVWRDETRLDRLFGADYAAYKERVPRWVPGFHLGWLRSPRTYS